MANTILTHQMIAREAAAMLVEEDNLIPNINTGYDGEFTSVNGYEKGNSIKIGVPPVPVTWTGSTFVDNDVAESNVTLTLDTQIGAGLKFTAVEKALDLAQFRQRFLRPTINSVRSQVRAVLLQRMAQGAGNMVGTSGTIPATRLVYAQAQATLDRFLAPTDDRHILFSSDANMKLQDTNSSLFNPQAGVSKEHTSGYVGDYAGFDFAVDQSLPLQIGGGTGYLVNGATQTGSSLTVDTGTGAVKKGALFTIAGVYAVHPITGISTGQLRQFVVTADYAGGAGSIPIYPAITPTTANVIGTVVASPADNAAVTMLDTVAAGARQNLAFHKNAFVAAFAPLPVLASTEGYTATAGNVSVRVATFGDGANDIERTRVDVLMGSCVVRADHICRITE